MARDWFRKFFAPRVRTVHRNTRGFQPSLVSLDERIAPAIVGTLYLYGNQLIYNGTAAGNQITVSQPAPGEITISDAAGEIRVNNLPGFIGGDTDTVSGIIPANVSKIVINGGFGIDTVNLEELDLLPAVQVTADNIDVNGNIKASGVQLSITGTGSIDINGAGGVTVDSTAATVLGRPAGNIIFGGRVQINTDDLHLVTDGPIDGNVNFQGMVTGSGGLTVNFDGGLIGPANIGGNVTFGGAVDIDGSLFVGNNIDPDNPVSGANSIFINRGMNAFGEYLNALNTIRVTGNLVADASDISILANQDGKGIEGFVHIGGDIVTPSTNAVFGGSTTEAVTIRVNLGLDGGGNGSAYVRGVRTGDGGGITIDTGSTTGGGSIIDNNGLGVLNLDNGAAGLTTLIAGGVFGMNLDTRTGDVSARISDPNARGNIIIRNNGVDMNIFRAQAQRGFVSIINRGGALTIDNNGDPATVSASTYITLEALTDIFNIGAAATIQAPQVNLKANTGSIGFPGDGIIVDSGTLTANAGSGIFVTQDPTVNKSLRILRAVTASGDIELTGTGESTNLVIAGPVQAGGAITIDASISDALSLVQTGAIRGDSVTIIGSAVGTSNIDLRGPITATGGNITVDVGSSAANNVIRITGVMTTPGGATEIFTGDGNNTVTARPSAASAFNFAFGAGNNALIVSGLFARVVSPGFVDFNAPLLQDWNVAGNVTVF